MGDWLKDCHLITACRIFQPGCDGDPTQPLLSAQLGFPRAPPVVTRPAVHRRWTEQVSEQEIPHGFPFLEDRHCGLREVVLPFGGHLHVFLFFVLIFFSVLRNLFAWFEVFFLLLLVSLTSECVHTSDLCTQARESGLFWSHFQG